MARLCDCDCRVGAHVGMGLKCLAVSNSFPPDHAGGYELGAGNLLGALKSNEGWDVKVISSFRKEKPDTILDPALSGYFPGRLGTELESLSTGRHIKKHHDVICEMIDREARDADVVLVFNPRRLIIPQWARIVASGTPVVFLVSDYWPEDFPDTDKFYEGLKKDSMGSLPVNSFYKKLYSPWLQEEALLGKARGVIYASEFIQNYHQNRFPADAMSKVIHWGISVDRFTKSKFDARKLKTFGFCGRAEKEKGLREALEAFREVASSDDDARFVVCAGLHTRHGKEVRKWVRGDSLLRERVELLGEVAYNDLQSMFYDKIGTLVFPSIWDEPFALTVLEAMASGTLVMGSQTGGTPEVLDNSTGLVFDPTDPNSLLSAYRKVLSEDDSVPGMIEAAYMRIQKMHTLPIMAKRVNEMVRKLI